MSSLAIEKAGVSCTGVEFLLALNQTIPQGLNNKRFLRFHFLVTLREHQNTSALFQQPDFLLTSCRRRHPLHVSWPVERLESIMLVL